MKKLTSPGMATSARTDIVSNAVILASVVVILLYVFLGPTA